MAQRKPSVLTAFVFLGFFLWWLKKLEVQTLGRVEACFHGIQMDPKTIHPPADLGWRPNGAMKLFCAGPQRCLMLQPAPHFGRAFVQSGLLHGSLQVITAHFCTPRSISRKEDTLRCWIWPLSPSVSFPGLCFAALLPPPLPLLSRAAWVGVALDAHSPGCFPRSRCGKDWPAFPLCHACCLQPPDLSSWH